MTKKELRELIKNTLKEYTGTGSGGGNATDGNNVQSQRPFTSDNNEIDFYNKQNKGEGGQGTQTRGMEKTQSVGNPNRSRFTRY